MKLKWYHLAILALVLLLAIAASAALLEANAPGISTEQGVLYQVSTLDSLNRGGYTDIMSYGEVKQHGDFGLGTFDGLNGEMVALNGSYYQITSDGKVHPVTDDMMTPFAGVTYFHADRTIQLNGTYNFTTLTSELDKYIPSNGSFYAIRIDGDFPYMKVRAPPLQVKPYPPLAESLKNQSIFELHNVDGTIVGLYTPRYAGGVQAAGYHLHFITDDRTAGGHAMDFTISDPNVKFDTLSRVYLVTPAS